MNLNVHNLYCKGLRALIKSHDDHEHLKLGILRAGNAGLVIEGDAGDKVDVIGKCHRQTYLRYMGVTGFEPVDYTRELMFDLGRLNEDAWVKVLTESWIKQCGGTIRCEEEIPISWKTSNGTLVTGRPDVVLCNPGGVPEHGLELKQICSFNMAKDALLNKPKLEHLIQAAHYSMELNAPFDLWYTNRVNWPLYFMESAARRNLPKPGDPSAIHLTYDDEGEVKSIEPFRRGFRLRWAKTGALEYSPIIVQEGVVESEEPNMQWETSVVTKDAIRSYFEFISQMESKDELGPLPKHQSADGTGKYSMCKYCSLDPLCKEFKKAKKTSLKEWTDKVKESIK